MSGCDWQKKSFSVAILDKPIIICRECNDEVDILYKYNGDTLCKKCFSEKRKISIFGIGNFNTHKDKTYSFITDMFNGKPIEIHSKGHFKKLLKQYKMVDASIKECRQEADFRKRLNDGDSQKRRKDFAKNIFLKRKIKFNARSI